MLTVAFTPQILRLSEDLPIIIELVDTEENLTKLMLMRLLAFITPEPTRFALDGSVQIIGVGALWGGITAPLLMVLTRWKPLFRRGLWIAPWSGGDGSGVGFVLVVFWLQWKPRRTSLFIIGAVVFFPLLFIAHGYVLEAITRQRGLSWSDVVLHRK